MILVPAVPDDSFVEALERVRRKTGERWSTDFVIRKMRNGEAGCYQFRDGVSEIAWMVVEAYGEPLCMNVWILVGDIGIENRAEVIAHIDALATSIGAKSWKLESPRIRAWRRMLRGYMTRERIVLERELP